MRLKLPLSACTLKKISYLMVFIGFTGFSQTKEDIEKITSSYDLAKLQELEKKFAAQYLQEKSNAMQFASQRSISIFKKGKDNSFEELQRIEPDGTPIYFKSHANNAVISARLNYLYPDGNLDLNLMGQNMTAFIWDGGHPRISHFEYDGPYAENRVTIEDAVSEGGVSLLWHAGMVTGIIASAGMYEPNGIGMAPYCSTKNYKWNNHLAEATAAAANGMLLSNHSYGWNTAGLAQYLFGSYNTETADWDTLLYNAPYYLMVTSAGNDGQGGLVYDQLTGRQLCKNNLTVANVSDAVIDNFGNLVSTAVFTTSSTGPSDELRIKPDISGNGVSVSGTDVTNDYASTFNSGGTSFAAPNVTGALLLLQQHYKNLNGSFMKAATLKGLALHTADDVGTVGPDAKAGWGLINAKEAVQTITRNGTKSSILELTLAQGQTYSVSVTADGINKLMASISWTDAPGIATTDLNSPLSRLVNDLDIRITKNATVFYPYKLTSFSTNSTGDNTVDPYERIDISNPTGTYTITVTHKGTLSTGSQNFSLIITGISTNCTTSIPFEIISSEFKPNGVNLKWKNNSDNFYTIRYRVVGSNNWTTETSSEKQVKLTGLSSFTNYEVQINSFCPLGDSANFSPSTFFTTSGTYCPSSSIGINTEELSTVSLNTINNYSEGFNASGYKDYTDLSTSLVKDENSVITIKPVLWQTYSRGYAVWIDYNRNGSFSDSGELVFSQSPTTATTITGTFLVPASALLGGTRMRVSMKVSGIPGPCDTGFADGEVEDYTVIIKDTSCLGQTIWDGTQWSNGEPYADLHAVIEGNYIGNGFASCKLDVIGNASVTINSGSNLIIEGTLNVSPTATLELLDDSSILQLKNVNNTGNVTIQKKTSPLKRLDYVLWSAPVTSQNLSAFSPQTLSNRFYTYNSSTNLYNTVDPNITDFTTGYGYLIRMPNNHPTTPTPWSGEFTGVPNNGEITIPVPTYSYIAIGNPYPSPIDCFSLMIDNELYYESIYYWRKENNTSSSSYATYTPYLGGLANSGDPNQLVPSRYIDTGQGFIVKTDYRNTITFKNSMRLLKNNTTFLRASEEESEGNEKHAIYLNLTNHSEFSSNAMIGYLDGATTGIDPFVDGRYINDSPNALTTLINDEEFTLQGRGLPFDSTDEVPLGFKTQFAGNYSLSLSSVSGIFAADQGIYVEDTVLGITQSLKESTYNFTSEPGQFNTRFKIKFRDNFLGISEDSISGMTVYYSNGFLNIISKNEMVGYELYDMTGRLLLQQEKIQATSVKRELHGMAKQCLIVKVTLADGNTVSRKITN